jgi:hypothetical protein
MRCLPAVLLLLATTAGLAEETPVVRVDVTPDAVAVGESLEVRVTVLVPTWFARPPVYPDFELANAITRLPPDSSYPTSERIGRDTWSGIVRNYRVYPLVGASYRLSGETIKVAYANPGADPVETVVPVPEILFRGTVPAGAETLEPYVAGKRLALDLEVEGETSGLEPGDAVVLQWTAALDGLPAIFIPPLAPVLEFAGASVYADQPMVDDGPPGRRTEKVTLVFEAGGDFEIPAVSIDYWNTDAGKVETAKANGMMISVAGPPPAAEDNPLAGGPIDAWRVFLLVVLVAMLLVAATQLMPIWRERARQAEVARIAGEPWAFEQATKALQAGDADAAYAALVTWANRLEPAMSVRGFAARFGDAALVDAIDALSRACFAGAVRPDLGAMQQPLAAARSNYLHTEVAPGRLALPSLNPT